MVRRLTHHRAFVAAVLATVLIAVAVTGAGAAQVIAPQGLHAPRVAEQHGVHRIGDVHAGVTQRLAALGDISAVSTSTNVGRGSAQVTIAAPHAPGDWRKLTSGLVPLPLRI